MIEKTILDYLNSELDVPAYMEKPETIPGSYVLIEKTGSGRRNHINTAMVAVQSIAGSLYEAAQLNEQVKAAMDGLITLPGVSRSALNSDYNFTDPDTGTYRYQAVYDLVHD